MRHRLVPALIGLLFGLILAVQVKTASRAQATLKNSRLSEELVAQFVEASQERDRVQVELTRLRDVATQQASYSQLQDELQLELASAGLVAVQGQGITIRLADRTGSGDVSARLQPKELIELIFELRAAEAEAIAVNGMRVVANTAITRAQDGTNVLLMNGQRLTGPLLLEAVGDPPVMSASVNMRGGVVQSLIPWIPVIQVTEAGHLVIPAAPAPRPYKYAKPVKP